MLLNLLKHIINKVKGFPKAGVEGKGSLAVNNYACQNEVVIYEINILTVSSQ